MAATRPKLCLYVMNIQNTSIGVSTFKSALRAASFHEGGQYYIAKPTQVADEWILENGLGAYLGRPKNALTGDGLRSKNIYPEEVFSPEDKRGRDPGYTARLHTIMDGTPFAHSKPSKSGLAYCEKNYKWCYIIIPNTQGVPELRMYQATNHGVISLGLPVLASGDITGKASVVDGRLIIKISEINDISGGYNPSTSTVLRYEDSSLIKPFSRNPSPAELKEILKCRHNALRMVGVNPEKICVFDNGGVYDNGEKYLAHYSIPSSAPEAKDLMPASMRLSVSQSSTVTLPPDVPSPLARRLDILSPQSGNDSSFSLSRARSSKNMCNEHLEAILTKTPLGSRGESKKRALFADAAPTPRKIPSLFFSPLTSPPIAQPMPAVTSQVNLLETPKREETKSTPTKSR